MTAQAKLAGKWVVAVKFQIQEIREVCNAETAL